MPYVLDPNLENDDDEQQQASGSAPVKLSGGSSTAEASAPSGSSVKSDGGGDEKRLETGSGFQNLDKYLSANSAQNFGQKVVDKTQSGIDTAKQNQQTASDAFKNQVNQSNYTPTGDQISQAIAKPQEANTGDFQKWLNQSYEGPKSLGESQNTWNQYWGGTDQAQQQAKALGNEAGRFTLLDSYFGKPSYNFGEKSLDNLLVQQSGLGRETQKLQNQATQLGAQGQQGAKALQDTASQRSAAVDQSRQQARGAVGLDENGQVIRGTGAGTLGSLEDRIDSDVTEANAKRAQDYQDLFNSAMGRNFTPEQIQMLGYNPSSEDEYINISKFLNKGADLGKQNVMSGDQQAYINALSQLAGVDNDYASNPLSQASQLASLNQSGLQQARQGFSSSLNNLYSQMQQQFGGDPSQTGDGQFVGNFNRGVGGRDWVNSLQGRDLNSVVSELAPFISQNPNAPMKQYLNQMYDLMGRYK